jgi:hypothetical protein
MPGKATMRPKPPYLLGHILGTNENLISTLLILDMFIWCPEGDLKLPQTGYLKPEARCAFRNQP